jgi:hypothetical protein
MTNFLSIPITHDNNGNPISNKSNHIVNANIISGVWKAVAANSTGGNNDEYAVVIDFVGHHQQLYIYFIDDPQGYASNTMVDYIQNAILEANQSRAGHIVHTLTPPLGITSFS